MCWSPTSAEPLSDVNKLALTLYDVFGDLLPGYVVLLATSFIRGPFVGSWFFSLSLIANHPILFGIADYLLGR